jgi:putative transposase
LRGARRLTYADSRMKNLLITLLHFAVVTAKLCGPGGVRAVIAENLVLKQQLIVLRRGRQRAPNLALSDRLICGLASLLLSPGRIRKVAIGLRPATLLAFHQALVHRKYRRLFSSSQCQKTPGPKGPSDALIQAIVELKSRNPRFGCPRIARIIAHTFGVDVDKNVVYRVLAKHYRPAPGRHRALLAVVHRTHARQPVERGSVSMRVHCASELLGAHGHGRVHLLVANWQSCGNDA